MASFKHPTANEIREAVAAARTAVATAASENRYGIQLPIEVFGPLQVFVLNNRIGPFEDSMLDEQFPPQILVSMSSNTYGPQFVTDLADDAELILKELDL